MCHSIRSIFRVLGIYNFEVSLKETSKLTQKCYIVFISSGDKHLLYESLEIYKYLILNPDTKDDVFELAANKSIGLLSKLEKEEEILTILVKMVRRFPKNYSYKKCFQ